MIRVSAFLFILSAALSVGLIIHFSDIRNDARYVGVEVCGACHATTSSGLVFQDWNDGPHQRAYHVLQSDTAQQYLRDRGLTLENCLQCHTTLGRSPANAFEEELNLAGVGCERCHGPGSEYVQTAIMKDPELMQASGGSPGDLADCYSCHADNPKNHDWSCPFQENSFDSRVGWQEVGHSRAPTENANETEANDSLDIQSGNQ